MKSYSVYRLGILFVIAYITFSTVASGFDGGDGTEANPYEIATAEHLVAIGSRADLLDKHFVLTADIDLCTYSLSTALIAPDIDDSTDGFQGNAFTGSFNGNGHRIINLSIDTTNRSMADEYEHDYLGLFGLQEGLESLIENLTLENASTAFHKYHDYATCL